MMSPQMYYRPSGATWGWAAQWWWLQTSSLPVSSFNHHTTQMCSVELFCRFVFRARTHGEHRVVLSDLYTSWFHV